MYGNVPFYLSDFDFYRYFTRIPLATLANLSEFRQMQDTSTHNESSYKYGCNNAQYRPVLSQFVGAEQEVLYTPDLQKPQMNKPDFTPDSASRRESYNMNVAVTLSGTSKSQTYMDPDIIAPFMRPISDIKSPNALAELKVLNQRQAVPKGQKKNQIQPTRYSPYQTYKKVPVSTPKDRNRRHIFKQQCRRFTSLPLDTLEMIPQSGYLPLPPKSEKSSAPYNMTTPQRRPFNTEPQNLHYSQSKVQHMTTEAEAVSLLLILSQAKNIEQRQITPQHETMPALTKNISRPEITFQEKIMPELKTTDDQSQDVITQNQTLPLIKSLDWCLMMQNQDRSLQQPVTMKEKVDLIISEACRKMNIGATSQTILHLNDEFDKLIIRLKTKGFNIENPENNLKDITNFVIPNSHESATIPDVEQTETPESKGDVKKLFEEQNRYKYKRQLKTSNQHYKTPINDEKIPIGLGYASVSAKLLKNMNWTSYTNCTRKLMSAVFSRSILATHSLTGKASPAFPGKPAKKMLDQTLINDIVQTIMDKCGVTESQIRVCITTKCADESKMLRMREGKNYERRSKKFKENYPPSSDSEEE